MGSNDPCEGAVFRWPIRVYYEDTDAGGVVYHANYIKFFERARSELLRGLGFELDQLRERENLVFVVRSLEVDFLKPAKFNEALWVATAIGQVKAASLVFRQVLLRGEEALCKATVKVACLAADEFRPRPLPEFIVRSLQGAG
jgi:acyl-CoA thioester hydrolase